MSQDPNVVNVYMIDQETKRKLLFKINPIMLGKPENTTILFPNGIEYKLVETEPSDTVKITKFYDQFDIICKTAADKFPDYGYPEKPNPTRDEQVAAMMSATQAYLNNDLEPIAEDETGAVATIRENFRNLWKKEDQMETIKDIAYQKLCQWVTNNRSLVYAKKLMEERQLDTCYPKDYLLRLEKVFKEICDDLAKEKPELEFIQAIQKISIIFADMQNDFRQQSGKNYIMEAIHYYEPVQIMYQTMIKTIVELHRSGTKFMLKEEYPGDKEKGYDAVTSEFWKAFEGAMKSCYESIQKKNKEYTSLVQSLSKYEDNGEFNRHILAEIRDIFGKYEAAYEVYNAEMKDISSGKSEKDANEVTQQMYREHLGAMIRSLDRVNIEVVSRYSGKEEEIQKHPINELFFSITNGMSLIVQHNQNGTKVIGDLANLIQQFRKQMDEAEKNKNNLIL